MFHIEYRRIRGKYITRDHEELGEYIKPITAYKLFKKKLLEEKQHVDYFGRAITYTTTLLLWEDSSVVVLITLDENFNENMRTLSDKFINYLTKRNRRK